MRGQQQQSGLEKLTAAGRSFFESWHRILEDAVHDDISTEMLGRSAVVNR